jgi:hypothetical protein
VERLETDGNKQEAITPTTVTGIRKRLFGKLETVFDFCEKKIRTPKKLEADYQSYLRIQVAAVSAYGKILNDADLEDVKQRIDALEKSVGKP